MVILYARQHCLLRRLAAALEPHCSPFATTDWRRFQDVAPSSECAVIALREGGGSSPIQELYAFNTRFPSVPLVLVVRRSIEELYRIRGIRAADVVWIQRTDVELWPVVRQACGFGSLGRLADVVEAVTTLPPQLRRAIGCAFRSLPPVLSVSRLARMVDCPVRTLQHQWRCAMGDGRTARLKDLLRWVVLLRAAASKVPGQAWHEVAHALDVHHHTLGRTVARLTGGTLRGLDGMPHHLVWRRFQEGIVHRLLGETALRTSL